MTPQKTAKTETQTRQYRDKMQPFTPRSFALRLFCSENKILSPLLHFKKPAPAVGLRPKGQGSRDKNATAFCASNP